MTSLSASAPSGIDPASCAATTSTAAPCLTLLPRLADAEDRDETGPPCAGDLAANDGVGLAMTLAALGMADDHMAAAEIRQHLGADVAGEGALWARRGNPARPSAMPLPARVPPPRRARSPAGRREARSRARPPAAAARCASARASAAPSSRKPFIFQLPATSFVRIAMLRPRCPAPIIRPTRSHRRSGGSIGPGR